MSPALTHYLKPDLRSIMFTCKGLSAVALALAISMSLDLDKPFWAMVASMMLQARPEAGLVIEKAACLVLGSTVGAAIAILILDNLTPYPVLAIGALVLCVAVTSAIASTIRHVNFVFATALVSVTAILIVLFAMADPANTNSGSIFMVVRARLSEVLVGASSAILASVLLYPFKVQKVLETGMNRLRDLSLTHVSAILQAQSNPTAVHQQRIGIIALATSINDDANAGRYELASNVDAALITASNAFTIVARGQTIERILSDNPKRLPDMLARFVDQHAHGCSLLETESLDKVSEALSAMRGACDSIAGGSHGTQRFPRFNRHRDWLVGLRSALRSSLVFLSAIGIWIMSGEHAALIMMIVLPALLSQIFSSHPAPRVATAKLLGGALIAIPIAILFVLSLLAQGSADFEMLILVLSAPLFLGLMSMTSPTLAPYGLGFCLTLAVIVQPSNYMTFAIDQCLSTGLGIAVGLGLLYVGFDLLGPPKHLWLQRRLINALKLDLQTMRKRRLSTNWLNQRAAERLSYLTAYEPQTPVGTALTRQGLNVFESGHRMKPASDEQ
ncbi:MULTISPECIES: FUSC family protein [Pseudomonas]|uniref:FUSC family protein n=1 Tax=Pseudomonas fluorescens TaxID=294 RepID=A0A4Y9TJ08_PSEFL|nr:MULTISPECIES: FUSC family protein [Pseudomonas]MBD8271586.1 FUSC family protein [Pseudomonas fluorescens]TFW44111.1 FUSC family protein [Pseudomonas fluorescens]